MVVPTPPPILLESAGRGPLDTGISYTTPYTDPRHNAHQGNYCAKRTFFFVNNATVPAKPNVVCEQFDK